MRAAEWAEGDCDNERMEVYYVPRTVQVRTRVRKEFIRGDVQEYERMKAVVASIESKLAGVDEEEAEVERAVQDAKKAMEEEQDVRTSARLAEWRASRQRVVKTKDEYLAWLGTLESWAISKMAADGAIDEPEGSWGSSWMAVMMYGAKAKDKHFKPGFIDAVRESLATWMAANQMAMVAPEAEDNEYDEGLVW